MNNNRILHFTLGPVQGFVSQARRTRDLWGGSFILSWLSGHAMKAVLNNGGKIIFPIVHDASSTPTDHLLKAIMKVDGGQPSIGTIPNRFKAEVPEGFDPKLCTKAIQDAWLHVCRIVRDKYISPVATQGKDTAEIWRRQTEGFWEIAWVCDKDPGEGADGTWLDSRKNWRNHRPPDEGGDHCMIMGEWQELSGFVQVREKDRQKLFWQRFREQQGIGKHDLREGERLCAIALVKRLFPNVAQEAIGWQMDIRNWPSTSYMAAIPWIVEAWQTDKSACLAYAEQVKSAFSESVYGERDTRINCLDNIANADNEFRKFAGLDGNLLQSHALANDKLFPADEDFRDKLLKSLSALKKQTNVPLTPYYALLIMDGDKMGAQLRQYPQQVSNGLAKFTNQVKDIVSANNGVTIYAGGDDVLAMFPLDDAINAAHELRYAYQVAFDMEPWASISAAIVYAHHHQPLRSVLHQAHRQLDQVAKERNNRNSLALCVLKGGDISSAWVGCWEPESGYFPAKELATMAKGLSADSQFSSRFLYTLRDRLADLMDADGRVVLEIGMVKQVLLAEYLRNREIASESDQAIKTAGETVDSLVRAVTLYRNTDKTVIDRDILQPDGPIVLRFLAFKGVDE